MTGMASSELLAWCLVGVQWVVMVFLYWRLDQAHARHLELQDQRVKDTMQLAGTGQGWTEPAVQDVPSADETAQKAVKALDEEIIFRHLRKQADEAGRQVSDSRLREDARKMLQKFGMGPRAPNV